MITAIARPNAASDIRYGPDAHIIHLPQIGPADVRGHDQQAGRPVTIAELCRREGIAQSIYYKWSKEFMEAGKRRLAGDTARAASTDEVKNLRRESHDLKEVVAEQALELRLLKKSMIADGQDIE